MSDDRRKSHLTPPPPQKRIKSIDLYRAQHGISPDPAGMKNLDPNILAAAAALRGRERNRSKENTNRSRDSSSQDLSKTELRDSLLGQALEASSASSVQSLLFILLLFFFRSLFRQWGQKITLKILSNYFHFVTEKASGFGIFASTKHGRRL